MKILLYGINYSPELTGIGKYSGEFAKWCAEEGHDVRVVTAPPYYPDWKVGKNYSSYLYQREIEDGVTVIRCPLYVPAKPSTIKRMLHLSSFAFTSAFALMANLRWKPDVVLQVVPTLFCSGATLVFCKMSGAKSVIHIQDYELDAMFGLSMAGGGGLKRVAYGLEGAVLKGFDKVSTISKGMIERARDKGVDSDRLVLFPNWAEVERFRNVETNKQTMVKLGVDPDKKLVLYSGSMGEKQGLESVLGAAQSLQHRQDIQFLLVGEGGAKSRLIESSRDMGIQNVQFAPLQPYELLPELLAAADCHLVIQKRGAADSMLPSKLTNILAVGGNAVITADLATTLGELVADWPGIACCVEPESADALVEGIEEALRMPDPNSVAIAYADKHLDKNVILTAFIDTISAEDAPIEKPDDR